MSAGAGGMNISTYLGSFLALLRNASAFDRIEDWNGAADLDEKLHRNKQKRLAQEEAAKIQARSYSTARRACFAETTLVHGAR